MIWWRIEENKLKIEKNGEIKIMGTKMQYFNSYVELRDDDSRMQTISETGRHNTLWIYLNEIKWGTRDCPQDLLNLKLVSSPMMVTQL